MIITVRFFASLRATVGASQAALDVPEGACMADLVARLVREYPAAAGHEASWHFAVNHVHAELETPLQPGDRVAIFPYVAGG